MGKEIKFESNIKNIFIIGMGGSGEIGNYLQNYLHDLSIPVFVVKDYELPTYCNQTSLVFVISYSGNTEETISAYRQAWRRGCKNLVSVSSGGKLMELALLNKHEHITIPSGILARFSTPYLLVPILNILYNQGLIDYPNQIVEETAKALEKSGFETKAKELAEKLKNKVPIIYSSQRTQVVAEKWKTDIQENAKTLAYHNVIPEMCHNELNAYEKVTADLFVILIGDEDDHRQVKQRIKIIKKMLKEKEVPVMEIGIKGNNLLTRLFSSTYLGLWVAFYLAMEYEIDPTPVETIEWFKKELKEDHFRSRLG